MDKKLAFVPVCAAADNILMKRYCIAQCLRIFEKVSFEFSIKNETFCINFQTLCIANMVCVKYRIAAVKPS